MRECMRINFVHKASNLVFGLNYRRGLYLISKILLVSLIIVFFGSSFSEAAKKWLNNEISNDYAKDIMSN